MKTESSNSTRATSQVHSTKDVTATSGKETAGSNALSGTFGQKPTTFELAMLAELLALRPGATSTPQTAVLEAMEFWDAADKFNLAAQQLRELREGLFDLKQEQWDSLVKQYVGDTTFLHDWLNGQRNDSPRFDVRNEVLPKLFTAKNETRQSREEKLTQLLDHARAMGWSTRVLLPDPRTRSEKQRLDKQSAAWRQPPIPIESLLDRRLSIKQTRWLVTARQAQQSRAKSHPKA